jgi:hypothetical protein
VIRPHAVLVALLVALIAIPARGEDGGTSPARTVTCLKNARTARNQCMRDATERCNRSFDGDLQSCFGAGNNCVRGCIGDHERCLAEPQGQAEGCRIACGSDQKVALRGCKVQVDVRGCQDSAKKAAVECKQRCTAKSAPAKQQCGESFNDCLNKCAG